MSSTMFKAVVVGAVAAGAFLLPVTAAQAAVKGCPCDGGSSFDSDFYDGGFGFQGGGFQDHDAAYFGDDDGFGSDLGFGGDMGLGDVRDVPSHHRHHGNKTITVIIKDQRKHHGHKHVTGEEPPAVVSPASVGNPKPVSSGYGHKRG